IDKWIDTSGNTIKYEYIRSNNVTYIKKIKWSENENIATNGYYNEIEFNYKSRLRPEIAFLHGVKMINDQILDFITVKTGNELFRKYQLTHDENELKYQNVSQIVEFNGNNESANPLIFQYDTTPSIDVVDVQKVWFETDISADPYLQYSGDFDGDGRLDAVINKKLYRNLFSPLGGENSVSDFNYYNMLKSPINTLENGKLLQAQALVEFTSTMAVGSDEQVLENHQLFLTPNKLNTFTNHFEPLYTRTIDYPYMSHIDFDSAPEHCDLSAVDKYYSRPQIKFIEGDFNGDGISEFLVLGRYSV